MQIEQLEIDKVASERSFIWLWAGSTVQGLESALRCINKWGFRRVEDIVWSKTNKHSVALGRALVSKRPPEAGAVFQKTKARQRILDLLSSNYSIFSKVSDFS